MKRYIFLLYIFSATWSSYAYAALQTDAAIQNLPWMAVLIAGGLAAWGGLVMTINRLNLEMKRAEFLHWLLKDVVSAVVAGWFIFFVAQWLGWNVWIQALALLAGGYGGSRILDAASQRLIKEIQDDE